MMQQNITELHTIKVFVSIKHIHLLVRFPCRLSFQLKTQNGSIQTVNTYELKKGECEVNENLQIDFDIVYDNQRKSYQQKKIKLVVMMSSANGVIPAGMVLFSPCDSEALERKEHTLALQKCPDRSATIKFTRWYEFIRSSTNISSVQHSSYIDTRYTLKSNNKPSQLKQSGYMNNPVYSRSSMYSPANKRDITPSRFGSNLANVSSSNNNVVTTSVSQMYSNRARGQTITSPLYEGRTSQYKVPHPQEHRMAESYMQQPSYGHTASFYNMNQSAFVPGQYPPHSQQPHIRHEQSHQARLQFGQKASFLKQIAKLRGEVKSLQNEDKWEQLVKVKDENESLLVELQKQKEKYRNLEKKDREYNVQLKELKDEIQRVRVKLNNTQSVRNQLQTAIQQKDKKLKQSQGEIKRLQQKLSDLQLNLSAGQKRIQFKELSFQEQLQKMTEKYNASQTQRQKVVFEYNSLLGRMEENQKKYQLTQKDKERLFNEERNKLSKKVDTLTQQLQKLKEQFSDKQSAYSQLSTNYKLLTKRQTQKQSRLVQVQNQLQYMTVSYRKQEEQRKTLQSQIAILRIVEQQRNGLRKKHNETYSELSKTTERLQHLNNDYSILQNKYKDSELAIQQLKKERSQQTSKINLLTKQVEQLTKHHEKKIKEHESLSAENMNAAQRMNDLRSKLETQQRDYSEMAMQYEEQINYLTKSKEYADAEIQDLKWAVDRQREQYEQLVDKLKQATEESLQLNKVILQSGDKIKRLQQELSQTQSSLRSRNEQKLSLEQKERQLIQSSKQKSNQIYELSKKKLQLEQEVYILKEKLQQLQSYNKDKSLNEQNVIKEKEKELNALNQTLTKAQMENMHLQEEITTLSQSVNIRTNEIAHLKDNQQLLQQRINDLELKGQQLKEQLKSTNSQLTNTKSQRDTLKNDNQIRETAWEKLKLDWQEYRTVTSSALQQLIIQMSKDDDGTSLSNKQQGLLIFPDMNISSMQVEALKKRNTIITSYRQRIGLLQKQLGLSKQSVEKLKVKLEEKQNQHELVLLREKEKLKQLSGQFSSERQGLNEELRRSKQKNIQLLGEIEKLSNQIKKSSQIIEETKSQIKQLLTQREQLKLQIRNLQEKILQMKSYEIKSKASQESRFSQLNDQSEQEIIKMKFLVVQTERKVSAVEKIVVEKEEGIRKLQGQLAAVLNERNRLQQKNIQLNEKLNSIGDDKKSLQKRIKIVEKQLKQQNMLYQQAMQSVSNQKAKLQQTREKYNETFEQLTDAQVENEKLKQQLQSSVSLIASLQVQVKEKDEKYKVIEQRLSAEVKQHREKLISMNSQLQLKQFITKQLQQALQSSKQSIRELREQLVKKKEQIIRVSDQLEMKKNSLLQIDQSLNTNRNEKESYKEENDRLRVRIHMLQGEINQNKHLGDVIEMRDRQIRRLKEQIQTQRRKNEKGLLSRRSVSGQTSRLSSSRNIVKEDQSKRKIRELEQLLEVKHYDLSLERKKWQAQTDRKKRQLVIEINQMHQNIQNMQSEFDFQRAQLNKEIQSLSQQLDDLLKVLNEKEEIIYLIETLVRDLENGNMGRVSELKRNVEELKRNVQNRLKENSLAKDRLRQHHSFSHNNNWLTNNQRQHHSGHNSQSQIPLESYYFNSPPPIYNNRILSAEMQTLESRQSVPVGDSIIDDVQN